MLYKGEGGDRELPKLAQVICERPLIKSRGILLYRLAPGTPRHFIVGGVIVTVWFPYKLASLSRTLLVLVVPDLAICEIIADTARLHVTG